MGWRKKNHVKGFLKEVDTLRFKDHQSRKFSKTPFPFSLGEVLHLERHVEYIYMLENLKTSHRIMFEIKYEMKKGRKFHQ